MDQVVAIVGRPNVGKSTLFNRLVGRRVALVDNSPGVTRDYREGSLVIGDRTVSVIDTAGMDRSGPGELEADIRRVTERAVTMADICLFMIDGRVGVLPADLEVAETLRRRSKPVIPVVNKCEGRAGEAGYLEAYGFGLGTPVRISAEHGEGVGELLATMHEVLPPGGTSANEEPADHPLRIAIVGRPNAGKSSLVNQIIGDDRLVTGSRPGTTRDAIDISANWLGREVRIHDTAGMRKRSRVTERLEQLSVADSLEAIRYCEIVVLVLDAAIPLEVQDLRIADLAEREGRPVVVAVNKWDMVRNRSRHLTEIGHRLKDRLPELRGAPLVPVSALTGEGLGQLHGAITGVWTIWNQRVSTGLLNRWLAEATLRHPPPAVRGKTIRFRYMTQAKIRPPGFVAMCSHPRQVPDSYRRFLRNGLRQEFGFEGTPIRIYLRSRSEKNPFVSGS